MDVAPIHTLSNGLLTAEVNPLGGQLWRLVSGGRERLWHGDPAWWDYRAPILFPVVGRSPEDRVTIGGVEYPMMSHGFARDLPFAVLVADAGRLLLEQRASETSRRHYPFAYRLTMEFTLEGTTLRQVTIVTNDGPAPMPFCFGYHPAFLWPWDGASARDAHVVRFAREEQPLVRRARMGTGLMLAGGETSPLDGRELHLHDGLFERGSIQFPNLASRSVWFGVPGEAGLRVEFPNSPDLAIWTKPGAPYLCIEPWQGLAAEEGAGPALEVRPGARVLAPGKFASYRLALTCDVP